MNPTYGINVNLKLVNSAVSVSGISATNTQVISSVFLAGKQGIPGDPASNLVTSVAGRQGTITLVKDDVGLGSVDNTSDIAKPVSTAQQTALDGKQPLDADLTAIAGLSAIANDTLVYTSGAWANRTPAQLKTTLALNNVSNTNDASKPVSTATQTALDLKDRTVTKTVGVTGSGADYICNGSADEVEINLAITAVNTAGGGTVLLRAGTYTTAATIVLKSNVRLIGEGVGNTIITGAASDYRLAGTTLSGTTKTVYTNVEVRGITFKSNYGTGLAIFNTNGVIVDSNEFTFTVTTPIKQTLFIEHCQNVIVTDNLAHDYTGNGLSVTSTDYFTISGNVISGGANGDDGIDVDYDFLDTSAIPSNYGTVTGNTIRTIGRGNGIRVENSNYVTVSANSVDTVSSTASIAAGILINTTSTNAGTGHTVSGNTVTNCVPGGIATSGTNLTDVTITGNTIINSGANSGSVRGGILLNSAGVSVVGNLIDGTLKSGTDGAAMLIYKKDSHHIVGNTIKNSAVGLRFWNGDALQSYVATTVLDNRLDNNTLQAVTSAATSACRIFNNYGLTDFLATTTAAGVVTLAGDLGGTSALPTVPSRIVTKTVGPAGTSADYVCDGTSDNVEIQAALTAINSAGGGKLIIRAGTYNLAAKLLVGSNVEVEGEDQAKTILKMNTGLNISCLGNLDTTNGNSFIRVRNLTINQQGSSQTAGGGMSFTGLFDSTIEDVTVEQSNVFNLFIGSLTGTSLTGTLTFTNNDTTVTGSSTLFTSELAIGDIIRSGSNHFQRVSSITSNTSLELDRIWGWATETAVAAKRQPANARNRLLNCTFNGTYGTSDNVGLGLFDDSLVQGCISRGSTGYGFGPDHANRVKFIGNTCKDNTNAGIGMETCGYCVVSNNVITNCANGVYLLSGSYRNIITGNQMRRNTNGVHITYNSTSFPKPDENTITNNSCDLNTTHGIRVGGASRTIVSNNRSFNNGNSGIVLVTDNSIAPDKTLVVGNHCYDNQDTKTQVKGIWISGGTSSEIIDNVSFTADQTSSGLTDSGTGSVIINTNGVTNAAGLNRILPSQTSNSGKFLTTDGTDSSWATVSGGATDLSDLSDVDILTDPPTNKKALVFDDADSLWKASDTVGTWNVSGVQTAGNYRAPTTAADVNIGGDTAASGAGGNLNLQATSTTATGEIAGNMTIAAGGNSTDMTKGKLYLQDGLSSMRAELDLGTLTTDRVITFPDATGTIAFTSDITAASTVDRDRANHTGTQSADTLTDGTTNKAFLATERTKLTGIATSATANSSDATLLARANHTGTESADVLTDGTTNKAFLATERTKLSGIATAATANDTDANLKARANHTGTQAASTISDFSTAADARITVQKAAANGLASLGADTKVPVAQLPSGSEIMDAIRKRPFIFSDFLSTGTSSVDPFTAVAIASGTINAPNAMTNNEHHPGNIRYRSSTTTLSGYFVGTNTAQIRLGGGEVYEAVFELDNIALSTFRFGFLDSATSSDVVDGAYIEIDGSGVATGKTANNSTRSSTGTTTTLSASTWYRIRIVVDSTSLVTYTIYSEAGSVIWTNTNTTNIPSTSGRETGAGCVCFNSGTTAIDLTHLDFMALTYSSDRTR